MNSYIMALNLLVLVFSILGVVISFFIWRESSTKDIHLQEEIIRGEHQGEDLPINFITDSLPISLNIEIDYVKCTETEESVVYTLKRLIFGSNGKTLVKMSISWNRIPDEMPLLGSISLKKTISEKEDTDKFDGEIYPSGWGKQDIVIHSTNPKKVREEMRTFFDLVETSLQKTIDEDDLSNLDE